MALFDSGSAIGGAVAPALVVWLFHAFGTWRPAFLITGVLGFLWLARVDGDVSPAGGASAHQRF